MLQPLPSSVAPGDHWTVRLPEWWLGAVMVLSWASRRRPGEVAKAHQAFPPALLTNTRTPATLRL
eukprot:3987018-Alexandrium_andersonii.AAC.1